MELLKTISVVEFPHCYEEGFEDVLDSPYVIERIETNYPEEGNRCSIFWYGHNTNWKLEDLDKGWEKLENSEWVECEPPLYEIEYAKRLEEIIYERLASAGTNIEEMVSNFSGNKIE